MLWVGLAGVGWPAAEQRLEAKFDVALFQDALDCPLAQLAGQGEDGCDCVPQMSVSVLHPVELARLIRGRSLGSPAADLLRVDVHEFQLLSMNPVDAVNGSVVHHVRALTVARLGQSVLMNARVSLMDSSIMPAMRGISLIGCQFTGSECGMRGFRCMYCTQSHPPR